MFVALTVGMLKTLAAEEFTPLRAEIGIIKSAGVTACFALRKVAVRVVLYVPVY